MRNVRSLIEGWHGYVEDHQGVLPASSGPGLTGDGLPWHGGGWLDMPVSSLDNVDPYAAERSISQGAVWEYAGSDPSIWRCPADPSTGSHPEYMGGTRVSRVRSYSMNNWMNSIPWSNGWTVFHKISDFALAGPADLFLFSGERYDSINDGHMLVDMTGFRPDDGTRGARNRACRLVDFPSNYHRNAGVIGFVDGHVESHEWLDPRTTPPFVDGELTLNIGSPGNMDMFWLQSRATVAAP